MKKNPYFFVSTIIMIIVVFIGFTPSFIFRPVFKESQLPTSIIIHGIFNILWFVVLLYQSWNIYKGRILNHKKIGLIGFSLAAIIIIMNFYLIYMVTQKYHEGEYSLQLAAGLSLGNFVGYVMNSIIIILAFFLKHKPEYHKRLIFLFSLSLVSFASDRIGRMIINTDDVGLNGILMGYAVHVLFIIALIIYDIKTRKKPHFISILGLFIPIISLSLIFYLLSNGYGEVFLNLFL